MSATAATADTEESSATEAMAAGSTTKEPDAEVPEEIFEAEAVGPPPAETFVTTPAETPDSAAPPPMASPEPLTAAARDVIPASTPAPPIEAVPDAEPEPPPPPDAFPTPPPVGVIHPRAKRLTVYYLAAGLAGVAAVGLFPALREVLLHFLAENSPGVDLWAPIVILLGVVQLAYVVYAVQVPDWGSTRVLMVVSVVIAMFYAMVLGISVMAQENNGFVLSLGLTSEYHLKQITAWCFLMLMLMCTLAYFWARTTFRWRRSSQKAVAGPG
jgi:hypothetical protein